MPKIVTIYGGSGFLGRHVTRRMAKLGWRVRVAVRRPVEALFVRSYGAVGQVEPVLCNIRDNQSTQAAMSDADVVVNCVGTIVNVGKNRFDSVHVEGAERIGRLSREMGVSKVVHISALGANPDSESMYLSSKGRGEDVILHERPDTVILRPSALFGPDGGIYDRLAGTGFGPVVPIVCYGKKIQPVHVDDVAQAVEKIILGEVASGYYELGGPDTQTMRELAELTLRATYRRRLIVKLPSWMARLTAAMLDARSTLTGGLLTNYTLTRDQLLMLRQDNIVAKGATGFADLGIEPIAAEAVIDEYLWRFRSGGQYADMTASAKNLRTH